MIALTVNFFGHVVAASWVSDDSAFGLGSMLPDFATMVGARLVSSRGPQLSDGISWHHATDAVFHRHQTFRVHSRQLTSALARRGIGRGGSLAAGHVGVELLLDGLLLEGSQIGGQKLYLAALAELDDEVGNLELSSRRENDKRTAAERLGELGKFLHDRGLPHGYREPRTVAERVLRVVRDRPRLAIDPSKLVALTDELAKTRESLAPEVGELAQSLKASLFENSDGAGAGENPRAPSRR